MRAVFVLALALAVASATTFTVPPASEWYSVYFVDSSDTFIVKSGQDFVDADATGYYVEGLNETGFSTFGVVANPNIPYMESVYAAGYLEGYLTSVDLYNSYVNFEISILDGMPSTRLLEWVGTNQEWISEQISDYVHYSSSSTSAEADYWAQAWALVLQVEGITDGYNAVATPGLELTFMDLWLLNSDGDLYDLIPVTDGNYTGKWRTPAEAMAGSHCSCIMKPNGNNTEMLAAHEMWATYSQMIPIYKTYNLTIPGSTTQVISMSSYPGYVSSEDDWYILDSGYVTTETTNSMFNLTLYDYVTTESLPSWMRVMIANRLVTSGEQWASTISMYNSGTYNNQWMCLDMNMYTPGQTTVPNGTLWIAEQSPGYVETGDVSYVFNEQGYWPSYNIPFFPTMFERMGYLPMVAKYGNIWTHDECPRAQVFRRNESAAVDIPTLQALMRYNNFQEDPLAMDCPFFQIASRGDLAQANDTRWGGICGQAAFGAINAKCTSSSFVANGATNGFLIAGPTHEEQPVFQWSTSPAQGAHVGMPDAFDFDWVFMDTSLDN